MTMTKMNLDAREALTNSTIGLLVSWLITWAVLEFPPIQSIGITLMFFFVSTVRSYVIRRVFRRLANV